MKREKDKNYKLKRITIIGAVVNILLSFIKIAAGYFGHSQALIADGIHSFSDLITDTAIVVGSRFWSLQPDKEHPFGHQRIETLVTLGIGILLTLIGFEMIKNSVLDFNKVSQTIPSIITLVVAFISIVSKEALYVVTKNAGIRINSPALIANAWHHRSDALSSISVAVAIVLIRIFPDLYFIDNIATIIIALLLIKGAYNIIAPCIGELMDKQVHKDIENELERTISHYQEVYSIHKIRIRKSGSMHFIQFHMVVDHDMTVRDAHALTGKIKSDLKKLNKDIYEVEIHIEPYEE